MKRLVYVFCFIIFNLHSQGSDNSILEKTILQLSQIETVLYQSTLEAIENGTAYMEKTDTIYFDFTSSSATPKYFFKGVDSELIFDGKRHLQALKKDKLVITNDHPNANNPLLLTLYPLKRLLPQMMYNTDIIISRKNDTIINSKESFQFEFNFNNGFIDWQNLSLKKVPGAKTKYILITNKSDNLPSKIIMSNGPAATLSRTFDNWKIDYVQDGIIWSGSLMPNEYEKISFEEYLKRMDAKMPLTKGNSKKDEAIIDWKLFDLKKNTTVEFSNLRGNVILLEFWFKFCGPCVKAVPNLNSMHEKYKNEKFKLFGVEFREDFERENLLEYVKKINMNYPTLYKGKNIATSNGIASAPTFLLINKYGKIIYAKSGFDEAEITKLIEENL